MARRLTGPQFYKLRKAAKISGQTLCYHAEISSPILAGYEHGELYLKPAKEEQLHQAFRELWKEKFTVFAELDQKIEAAI